MKRVPQIDWKDMPLGYQSVDMGEYIYQHFAAGYSLEEVMQLPAVKTLYKSFHQKKVKKEIAKRKVHFFQKNSHLFLNRGESHESQ